MHEPVLPKPSRGENLATLCIPQVGRINTSFLISFSTTVKAELSSTGFPHSKTGKQKLWKLQGKKNSETMKKYFTFLRENCSSTLCLLYCNKLRDQNFNAHLLNASTLFIKTKHMLLPQIIILLQLLHSRSIPSPINHFATTILSHFSDHTTILLRPLHCFPFHSSTSSCPCLQSPCSCIFLGSHVALYSCP